MPGTPTLPDPTAVGGSAVATRTRRRMRVPLPRMPRRGPQMRAIVADERATAVEHLEELRWRLTVVIGVLVVAFVAAYAMADRLFTLLEAPLDGRFRIQTLAVTEPFFTTVTVAAHAAIVVAFPVLVFNAYRYVAPALQPWQRRAARPVLVMTPVLFAAGITFGYVVVLGPAIRFLLGMGADSFDVAVRARDYYSFVSTTLLAMGLVFLFPLVLVGLARVGVVTAARLRANRRYALLGIAVVAALLPTADPVSLLFEMLPLVALFEASIVVVALQERAEARATRRRAAAEAAASSAQPGASGSGGDAG